MWNGITELLHCKHFEFCILKASHISWKEHSVQFNMSDVIHLQQELQPMQGQEQNTILEQEENPDGKKKWPCGCGKFPKKLVVPMFIVAIAMLIGIGYVAGYFTRDRRTTTKEDTKDRWKDHVHPTTTIPPVTPNGPSPKTLGTLLPTTADCTAEFYTNGETSKGFIRFKRKNIEADRGDQKQQIIRVNKWDDSVIDVYKTGSYRFVPHICLSCNDHSVSPNHSASYLMIFKNGRRIKPSVQCHVGGHCMDSRLIWLRTTDIVQVSVATRKWNNQLSFMEVNKLYCP